MHERLRRAELRRVWRSTLRGFGSRASTLAVADAERALEEARLVIGQQAAVARFGRRALSGLDPQDLMDEAAAVVRDALGADLSSVLELLPGGEQLRVRAGTGWDAGVVGSSVVPVGGTQAGETIVRNGPVTVDDLRTDPRFRESTLLRRHGAVSGASVLIRGRERPWGVLSAHTRARRAFGEHEVTFLRGVANVLAAAIQRQRADDALREARDELRALIEASPVPIMAYDAGGIVTLWNPAAERVFGWSTADAIGRLLPIVADDQLDEFHWVRRQVLAGRAFTGFETRRQRKDGSPVDVSFSNAAMRDAAGRVRGVVAVVMDVTERRATEEALRQSEERLRLALEASHMGMWEWEVATGRVIWSPGAEALYGLEAGSFEGTLEAFVGRVHPDDRKLVTDSAERAVSAGDEFDIEFRVVWPDGRVRWLTGVGEVFRDEEGRPVRMAGVTHDVTDRRRREHALAFLARAGEALSASLDYEETLAEVARLAVPQLADCCIVDVVERGRPARTIAVVHVDPLKQELVDDLERRYPTDPSPRGSFIGRLIAAREAWLGERISDEQLAEMAQDPDHLADLRRLGLRSVIVVPLLARARLIGSITLLATEEGRRLGQDDLQLARDLARHAALSVDNARLYRQQSEVAQTLQQSLLPPALPQIPGVELAVRYRPAGEGIEAGGDFYDAFPLEDGAWAIVVGDVCGKGSAAAALTGLARHTLHAATALESRTPGEVLTILNETILRRAGQATFCTTVYGRLDRTGEGARLTVATGGHPLPLVVRADGTIQPAGEHGMLVGAFPDATFRDQTVDLAPGDSVVLYTDGLLEAHGGRLDSGETAVEAVLGRWRGASADELAEHLLRSMPPKRANRDDVAILVLRMA